MTDKKFKVYGQNTGVNGATLSLSELILVLMSSPSDVQMTVKVL